ncbi:MAG: hypothetical protein H6702_10195 [Myxococcales bacterium]|nr:hypothetical protein [Myxococcales bacterium]
MRPPLVKACLVALVLPGCGYRFVQPQGAQPIQGVALDPVDDTSADRGVGRAASDALRAAGVAPGDAGRRLGGVVTVEPEHPVAYGPQATAAWRADVAFTLRLRDADGMAVLREAPVVRPAVWQRGATPLETRANRRRAVQAAAACAARDALAAWRAKETP